ncbi:conjugal transfer protein TraH [Pseudomonas oryzihabitans]|uniref:DotD/TraH family lipoprotein n=1 Tax=Pseudomonas oryzihabitans TaxID=47885 RepID=UPI0005C80117|nr:DotD/TraH family lipoprotein [Pseudomonas oryzihabitans]KIZ49168.1 conjugal transfer protein TraH [Pseudomonas oryzihabitans]
MRSNRITAGILLAAVMLGGCASHEQSNDAQAVVDQQILEASQKIEMAQVDLYQAGALNSRVVMRTPPAVADESRFVSVSWQGDALQLLAKVAKDRGLEFSFEGVRMPLPVSIDVKSVPLTTLMAMIKSQVGYRADIGQDAQKITLHYNRPRA